MSEYRVASRYAKSLISLAQEQGLLEEVHEDMQLFSGICEENRDFTLMLKNPIISNDIKSKILREIFYGKVNAITSSFFDIITRKNREMLLPAITREFHLQYNIIHKIGMAKVTTVFALDDSLRADFKHLIGQFTGKKEVELEEEIDDQLIGGYVLRLGGKQINESLRSKLKELKLKFSKS